ncbi:hypothetical protein PMI42_03472 [Bradyrhizobium sp. YR681]|nr:hypothetical protein PMI42_03472 [Bradyrhizobium sp. YR681]
MSIEEARAQAASEIAGIEPAFRRCANYRVVPGLKEGKSLLIFPYWIGDAKGVAINNEKRRRGVGWVNVGGAEEAKGGTFITQIPVVVGIVRFASDPRPAPGSTDGSRSPGAAIGYEFILPTNITIDFSPDFPASSPPVKAWHGYFHEFVPRGADIAMPERFSIECIAGTSTDHLEAVRDVDHPGSVNPLSAGANPDKGKTSTGSIGELLLKPTAPTSGKTEGSRLP